MLMLLLTAGAAATRCQSRSALGSPPLSSTARGERASGAAIGQQARHFAFPFARSPNSTSRNMRRHFTQVTAASSADTCKARLASARQESQAGRPSSANRWTLRGHRDIGGDCGCIIASPPSHLGLIDYRKLRTK